MLQLLKKLFSTHQKDDETGNGYVEYTEGTVQKYRDKYPQIQMDEVRVPDMGLGGSISVRKWLKNDGDKIGKGEVICELNAGAAIMELESYLDGYIYYRQTPRKKLSKGQVICLFLSKVPT